MDAMQPPLTEDPTDIRNMIAKAHIIQTPQQKWKCPVCGDEPPNHASPPNPPGIPQVLFTTKLDDDAVESLAVFHCMKCTGRFFRNNIPALVPIEQYVEPPVRTSPPPAPIALNRNQRRGGKARSRRGK